MLAVALAALALQGTPAQNARLHDLVVNLRSFDGLARQVFGPGANADTHKVDKTLVRLAAAKKPSDLVAAASTLETQGAALRRTLLNLPTTNDAMASDLVQSLQTNLTLLRKLVNAIASGK